MQEFIWEVFVLFGVTWYYAYESDTNLSTGKDFTFPLDTSAGMKDYVCYFSSNDNLGGLVCSR
jgi:hypothetical protein